jgi:hypothetical protein
LFDDHPRLRAVIDAVLEGRLGRLVRPDTGTGDAALLGLGCYAIPGGDPTSAAARSLIEQLQGPLEIVVPDDDRWRALLAEVFGDRVADRSMRAFVGDTLDGDGLASQARALPEGYRLVLVGTAEAVALGPGLSPHGVDVFGGPEAFVRHGFGIAALEGEQVAAVSTTYARCSDKVEVAIATHPDHRERGLATAVGAAMLLECRKRSVAPHWNAFNPVSQRLALRLGLREDGVCEILMLDGARAVTSAARDSRT